MFPFSNISEHADGESPRTCVDLRVYEDASHRDLSGATLRFGLALGVLLSACPEKLLKNRSTLALFYLTSPCTRIDCNTDDRVNWNRSAQERKKPHAIGIADGPAE